MLLGLGRHPVSARNLPNLDAVVGCAVLGNQFFQAGAHARPDLGVVRRPVGDNSIFHQLDDLLQRDRRLRRINDSFELSF